MQNTCNYEVSALLTVKVHCEPPVSAHGMVYYPQQAQFLVGQQVSIQCTDGSQKAGLTCDQTGNWVGTSPQCSGRYIKDQFNQTLGTM